MRIRGLSWSIAFALGCGGDDGSSLTESDGGTETTSASTGSSTTGASGPTTGSPTSDTSGGTGSSSASASDSDGSTGGTTGGPVDDPDPVPPDLTGCDGAPTGTMLMVGPTDDYKSMIGSMQPGDAMIFAAGTYDGGLPIADLNGSPGQCFHFIGNDPAAGASVFTGSSSRNTVSLRDSSYVVVRNLELDGIGEAGDGVKAEGNATYTHHIVIEDLYIHGHGANQQIVGISTKCTSWSWVIRGNRIEGAGTGLYLGNSDGSAPFVRSLIENNVVVDTLGYNMQIKHQSPRPALADLPTDSAETIIRHNVFSKQNGANGGAEARPNLLVGHWPLSGPGVDDRYLIYGNFLFHNDVGESLFQGEGNVALYNNLLVNPAGNAVAIQAQNDVPRSIHVFFNTVVASGNGIRISGADPNFEQHVVGNAVYAGSPFSGGMQADNVEGAVADAAGILVDPVSAPGSGLDLHPQSNGLDGAVDDTNISGFMRWDRDFDRRPRDGSVRGAYAGPDDGSGWIVELDHKP